jgi:hypothetical protein
LREAVEGVRLLNPELAEGDEPDEALLRELARLAARHERLTLLFRDLRTRVGIPAPEED